MTRKQQIYQRLLNVSIILIVLNLALFFIDIMVLVFTGALDCSSEAVLCDVDTNYAFFGVTMWLFGILTIIFMITARVFHFLMQRGEKLMDASHYRKTLQKQEVTNFSESNAYEKIRSGKKIKNRTESDNQFIVNVKNNLSKIGNSLSNGWNAIINFFKEIPNKTKNSVDAYKKRTNERKLIKAKKQEEIAQIKKQNEQDEQQEENLSADKQSTTTSEDQKKENVTVVKDSLETSQKEKNEQDIERTNKKKQDVDSSKSDTKTTQKKKKKPKNITKTSLINVIYKETDLSKNKSSKFLDAFLEVIQDELVSRNDIEMDGIGHFTTIEMPAKDAVNPQTKEKIVVPAHHQVRFRFNDEFEEEVNAATEDEEESIEESIPKAPNKQKQAVNEAHEVIDPEPVKEDVKQEDKKEEPKEEKKDQPKEEKKDQPKEEKKDKPKEEKKEQPKEKKKDQPKKKKKRKKVTKTSLIKVINDETDLSKNKSSIFLDAFLEVIQQELVSRNEIEMNGIGHFTTIEMPAKDAVNPQTKEKIVVPAHHQVRFRFDDDFKDLVGSDEDEE